jgi:cation:H+ antiporter
LTNRAAYCRIALALAGVVPALLVALLGHHPEGTPGTAVLGLQLAPVAGALIFGLGIWCAATLLGWAAETAEVDISGSLALALLAIVAILPEYAVDVTLAFKAGSDPKYVALASANMNGATRLLIGLALPIVVLVGLRHRRKAAGGDPAKATWPKGALPARVPGREFTALPIPANQLSGMFFILVGLAVAMVGPAMGQVHLALGIALLVIFIAFLWHAGRGEVHEPELIGVAAVIGALPKARRRSLVVALFLVAAGVILAGAEPFVESLVQTGEQLHLSEYLLIQWLAPLASEAPEFIIALTLASRGKAWAAVGMLATSVINQWSCLVGSLPVAYKLGGGAGLGLHLDAVQREEFLLTASVTLLAVALMAGLRVPLWACVFILGVFALEFVLQTESSRLVLAGVNVAAALVVAVLNRRRWGPLFRAPFVKAA